MPRDHNGAIPMSESESPYYRAYNAKFEELTAAGRHPEDAAWEARQHAKAAISPSEAAANAALVARLGLTYGATPAPTTPAADRTGTPAEADAFDWDSIIANVNANRR